VQALLNLCIQQALETTSMVVGVAVTNIQMVVGKGSRQAAADRRSGRYHLSCIDSNRECVLLF
jgi:hypothetical protein